MSKIKQIGISELETLLSKALKKEGYTKFVLETPEMGQFVVVSFSIQDSDPTRNKKTALYDLKKLIKDTLEETNWKLTSQGVSERLGFITGRLKGYEREKDLLELAGKNKNEPNPVSDLDKRSKLEANSVVQMARISGKQKAIENIRRRRLEKEPDGFFLESSKGPYQCGVCGRYKQGNEIWWTLEGLRCADCWENMKAGVIPNDLKHLYSNDGQWISEWQIKSDYGVPPATRGKYVKQGFLKAKQLKDKEGTIYSTVFLVKENKEFLDKYPKIPSKLPKVTFSSTKGS